RRISIVRVFTTWAFGWSVVVGLRSTRSESTPWSESRSDAAKPTGPPPPINTGTSGSGICHHLVPQRSDPADADLDLVAWLQEHACRRADPPGRTRADQVAGLKCVIAR